MARGDVLRRAMAILDEREAQLTADVLVAADVDVDPEVVAKRDAIGVPSVDATLATLRVAFKAKRAFLRDVLNDLQLPGADSE